MACCPTHHLIIMLHCLAELLHSSACLSQLMSCQVMDGLSETVGEDCALVQLFSDDSLPVIVTV